MLQPSCAGTGKILKFSKVVLASGKIEKYTLVHPLVRMQEYLICRPALRLSQFTTVSQL